MTQPCDQKENIEKLFDFHEEKMKQLGTMEVRQVEIQGDVKHIVSRLDNGMSQTIHNVNEVLIRLEPVIAHHANVISKIEDIGWWISKSSAALIVISVLGISVWAIAHGWKP